MVGRIKKTILLLLLQRCEPLQLQRIGFCLALFCFHSHLFIKLTLPQGLFPPSLQVHHDFF